MEQQHREETEGDELQYLGCVGLPAQQVPPCGRGTNGPHAARTCCGRRTRPSPEECELLNAGSPSGPSRHPLDQSKGAPGEPEAGTSIPARGNKGPGCAASLPRRGSVQGQGRFSCVTERAEGLDGRTFSTGVCEPRHDSLTYFFSLSSRIC